MTRMDMHGFVIFVLSLNYSYSLVCSMDYGLGLVFFFLSFNVMIFSRYLVIISGMKFGLVGFC